MAFTRCPAVLRTHAPSQISSQTSSRTARQQASQTRKRRAARCALAPETADGPVDPFEDVLQDVRRSLGKKDDDDDEVPLDLVDGYLDNAKVRPKIDIDADEYMMMWKLRLMLHEDDFNKIFNAKSRRIGEL